MSATRYVVINAFGRSNRGDSVLLDQCINQIRLVEPGAHISGVVFEGAKAAAAVHPEVIWSERLGNVAGRGVAKRLKMLFLLSIAWLTLKTRWVRLGHLLPSAQRGTVEAYLTADIVVSAPGGYIHDTNFAYIIALLHIYLAQVVGAKVVLAPQSMGPLASKLGRSLARSVLGSCHALCVREGYSYRFLVEELGLPSSIVVHAGDSAFWDDNVVQDRAVTDQALQAIGVNRGEPYVGMTVVNWSFPNLPDVAGLRSRYFDGMSALIRHIHQRYGLRTVVFNQVAEDLNAVRAVAEKTEGAAIVDDVQREPDLLRAMIARSVCFVGTRFHSCIFAMTASRPVVAISYLPKTEHIMRTLGLGDLFTDIANFNLPRTIELVDAQMAHLGEASARVANAVERYRREQLQFQDCLRRLESSSYRPH